MFWAIVEVPALPGKQKISLILLDFLNIAQRACSLPPLPTIPAQFVKKFGAKVVPIYIERIKNDNFKLVIHEPISFSNNDTVDYITLTLNKILEKMIIKNPEQWIWTHNRWK